MTKKKENEIMKYERTTDEDMMKGDLIDNYNNVIDALIDKHNNLIDDYNNMKSKKNKWKKQCKINESKMLGVKGYTPEFVEKEVKRRVDMEVLNYNDLRRELIAVKRINVKQSHSLTHASQKLRAEIDDHETTKQANKILADMAHSKRIALDMANNKVIKLSEQIKIISDQLTKETDDHETTKQANKNLQKENDIIKEKLAAMQIQLECQKTENKQFRELVSPYLPMWIKASPSLLNCEYERRSDE